MVDYTELIISKLSIDSTCILKKPIRGCSGITAQELVFALVHSNNLSEAADILGYSSVGPIKDSIRKLLLPLFPSRSYEFGAGSNTSSSCSWRFELLSTIRYKYCSACDSILPFNNFGKHIGNDRTGLSSECSGCHTYRTKLQK